MSPKKCQIQFKYVAKWLQRNIDISYPGGHFVRQGGRGNNDYFSKRETVYAVNDSSNWLLWCAWIYCSRSETVASVNSVIKLVDESRSINPSKADYRKRNDRPPNLPKVATDLIGALVYAQWYWAWNFRRMRNSGVTWFWIELKKNCVIIAATSKHRRFRTTVCQRAWPYDKETFCVS